MLPDSLVMIGIGFLLCWASLVLFREYRRAFFDDPLSIMSLEVLFQMLRMGGPGYLSVIGVCWAFGWPQQVSISLSWKCGFLCPGNRDEG